MEVFNMWNLGKCRVFLFDEEKSNFRDIGKSLFLEGLFLLA